MYWEREQEIALLTSVLGALDPEDEAHIADQIICDLIEMELLDCHRAPVAQQAWEDEWNDGRHVTTDFVAKHYDPDPDD